MRLHTNFVTAAFVSVTTSVAICPAALTVDLRFADGSHSGYPFGPGPGSINFNAWAMVTGSSGNINREGLQTLIFAVKSEIVYSSGSGIVGGQITGTLAPGWAGAGSQSGVATNLSNDGIGDWGNASNTPITINSTFFRPRTTKSVNNAVDWGDSDSPAGSVHNTLPDGGVEFLVGKFTFSWTSFPAGGYPDLAGINIVPVTILGGTVVPAGWYENTADITAPAPTGSKSPTTGVFGPQTPNAAGVNGLFFGAIPEPTTIAALLPIWLAARRRRHPQAR